MCRVSPICEADDLLETVDTDDEPRGEHSTYGSPRQPSKHVELWPHGSGGKTTGNRQHSTHRPNDKLQEHIESPLHESDKASKECGECSTHVPSNDMQ